MDLWKKLERLIQIAYYQSCEQSEGPVLTKGDIVILSAILAERGIGNSAIWDCLQKDLVKVIEKEGSAQNEDLSTYSSILDCMFRACTFYHEPMVNKIGFECLQSNLLTPEALALNQQETIKFFRGIFWPRVLTPSLRQSLGECFEAYVRGGDFQGKTWLQILDISRYAEMPETFVAEIEQKVQEVYMLNQLDLSTVDQVKKNLSFTQRQMENEAEPLKKGRGGPRRQSISKYLNDKKAF